MYLVCCGRYQPFHNGHLSLLREAVRHPGTLVVGAIIPTRMAAPPVEGGAGMAALGDRRLDPALNPYTIVERLRMIAGALADEPWGRDVIVTPLPRPDVYWELIEAMFPGPRAWVLPVTDDPFEMAKEQFYRSRGDAVLRLSPDLVMTATRVRELLTTDRPQALALVPRGVARVLDTEPDAAAP